MSELELTHEAKENIREAEHYYVRVDPDLAVRFLKAVDNCFTCIIEYPFASPLVGEATRLHPVRRFPHNVFYRIKGNVIIVTAILHNHRDPGFWKNSINA